MEPIINVALGNPACQTCASLPGFEENIDFAKQGIVYLLTVNGKKHITLIQVTHTLNIYIFGGIQQTSWLLVNMHGMALILGTPSVVAQLAPSPAGLFDIAGNVRELVWYTGSGITKTRVYGGCYDYPESYLTGRSFTEGLRSASANNAGFRIVRRASR